ncbi:ArsR/SmtB family transcription factor [Streptococcus catagoni]|nr:transcriptional regulator [Streptococcus catagoni]
MHYTYSEEASSIVEQLFLPLFVFADEEEIWDFTRKEKEILKDSFAMLREIKDLLIPFKDQIQSYYLMGVGCSLLHSVYFYLERTGRSCQTVEEVHNYALKFSDSEIRECLAFLLMTEDSDFEKDFWDLLDDSTLKEDRKWYYSQFYRKPQNSMKELIHLSRQLVKIYQPYLEKGLLERRHYAKSFNLDTLAKETPFLNLKSMLEDKKEISLFILSPWLTRLSLISLEPREDAQLAIIVSCQVEKLLTDKRELDHEDFSMVLKLLSDTTRYRILLQVLKPHMKSKVIAQELAITGAAVSFHTQKLINAQILQFTANEQENKYQINKNLLNQVLDKIKADFDL